VAEARDGGLCARDPVWSVNGQDVDYKAIFAPYGLSSAEHAAGGLRAARLMDVNAVTVRPRSFAREPVARFVRDLQIRRAAGR